MNSYMDNFIEDEIISIEYIGETETVDIVVSGDNLFVANGILTHNSSYGKDNPGMEGISESIATAAVSDAILSIFQSEEDHEMGIIKLGMMKNRYGPRGMVQSMIIDYPTLSIRQSDEDEECMSGDIADSMSILERLANQ